MHMYSNMNTCTCTCILNAICYDVIDMYTIHTCTVTWVHVHVHV